MTDSDTRRPVESSGSAQDNVSWQRSSLGTGGRYTGRDYFDRHLTEPGADLPVPTAAPPGTAGRAIRVIGVVLMVAGLAGWLWLLLALVSSVGDGVLPDDPFGTRVTGIPLGSGGLIAILIGGTMALIGYWIERTARSRGSRVRWEQTDFN